jgi:hypothetical protein
MGESDLLLGPHEQDIGGCGTIPMPPMTPTLDRPHGGDEIAVALIRSGPGTTYCSSSAHARWLRPDARGVSQEFVGPDVSAAQSSRA